MVSECCFFKFLLGNDLSTKLVSFSYILSFVTKKNTVAHSYNNLALFSSTSKLTTRILHPFYVCDI